MANLTDEEIEKDMSLMQSFSLRDFTEASPLDAKIADNMVDVGMLQRGNGTFEYKAWKCFFNATEIYTRIVEEDNPPIWTLPKYYDMAYCGYENNDGYLPTILKGVTLSIVLIHLEHYSDDWQERNAAFIEKMKDYLNNMRLTRYEGTYWNKMPIPVVEHFSEVYKTLCRGIDSIDMSAPSSSPQIASEESVRNIVRNYMKNGEIIPQEQFNDIFGTDTDKVEQPESEDVKELKKQLAQQKEQLAESEKTIRKLQEELEQARVENADSKDPQEGWYTGEYEELSKDVEITLRERVVFFTTVLSLELEKKYTVFANLATFISELCNDQKNIAPFISRMKKPEEAAANAKAANKIAGLMKLIIPKNYRNDMHLKINQLIDSMKRNFPESEEE